jgi:hypothetical protein
MLYKNISKKVGVMGVISNLLRQVNAKRGLDLYRMNLTQQVRNANTMIVGLDVVNEGARSIIGMTASYSAGIMQYFSDVQKQELRKDQIGKGLTKSEQEDIVCSERTEIFSQFLKRAFKIYTTNNNGKRPEQIVIYRDGVGGPTYQEKVLSLEGPGGALHKAIEAFDQN